MTVTVWRCPGLLVPVYCHMLAACLLCLQHGHAAGKEAAAPEQQRKEQTFVRFKDVLQPPGNYFNPITAYYNMWCVRNWHGTIFSGCAPLLMP